jgi:hypothetical protein
MQQGRDDGGIVELDIALTMRLFIHAAQPLKYGCERRSIRPRPFPQQSTRTAPEGKRP